MRINLTEVLDFKGEFWRSLGGTATSPPGLREQDKLVLVGRLQHESQGARNSGSVAHYKRLKLTGGYAPWGAVCAA